MNGAEGMSNGGSRHSSTGMGRRRRAGMGGQNLLSHHPLWCELHECRQGPVPAAPLGTDHAKQEHNPTQWVNEWVCQPLASLQGRLLSHGWVEGILETGQGRKLWDGMASVGREQYGCVRCRSWQRALGAMVRFDFTTCQISASAIGEAQGWE